MIASSIADLLHRAGEIIKQSAERITNGEQLFDISGFTEVSTKQSQYFTITVRSCFLHNESSVVPANYQYAYEITQSMDKNAPKSESMQLERRYWKIDDLAGNVDEVDGPGQPL